MPRYPPVFSYVLLFLRRKESVLTPSGANTLLEIAPTLCGRAAFHVWHMKVLLYAVFKDRGVDSLTLARAEIV